MVILLFELQRLTVLDFGMILLRWSLCILQFELLTLNIIYSRKLC